MTGFLSEYCARHRCCPPPPLHEDEFIFTDRSPPLSPRYLLVSMVLRWVSALQCPLHPTDFYTTYDINVMLGAEVTSVDVPSHIVHTTKGMVDYNRLLVATGGPARSFKAPEPFVIPGADLRNIFVLREGTDAVAAQAAINDIVRACGLALVCFPKPWRGLPTSRTESMHL